MTQCKICKEEYIADLELAYMEDKDRGKCLVCNKMTLEPTQIHGKRVWV